MSLVIGEVAVTVVSQSEKHRHYHDSIAESIASPPSEIPRIS
jgi:hypothetical protein